MGIFPFLKRFSVQLEYNTSFHLLPTTRSFPEKSCSISSRDLPPVSGRQRQNMTQPITPNPQYRRNAPALVNQFVRNRKVMAIIKLKDLQDDKYIRSESFESSTNWQRWRLKHTGLQPTGDIFQHLLSMALEQFLWKTRQITNISINYQYLLQKI